MKSQLRIVADDKVKKTKKRGRNELKEYEGILPDVPENSFKQKKGKFR